MEILIADNCSTDNTVEIIKGFSARDPRIHWWINPHNLGCYGNSNACLKQAQGEYIKFLYHDDLLVSAGSIKKMIEVLETNPNVSLVVSASRLINKRSEFVSIWNPQGCSSITAGKKAIIRCLERKSDNDIGCPSMTLFRRQQALRGFDVRFPYMADIEMWFHLLEQGDLCWMAEPQAAFRVHPEQGSAEMSRPGFRYQDSLLMLELLMKKKWFWEQASNRMMFRQIYYKRKMYGKDADYLTSKLMCHLSQRRYFHQWIQHKLLQPIRKFHHKITKLA